MISTTLLVLLCLSQEAALKTKAQVSQLGKKKIHSVKQTQSKCYYLYRLEVPSRWPVVFWSLSPKPGFSAKSHNDFCCCWNLLQFVNIHQEHPRAVPPGIAEGKISPPCGEPKHVFLCAHLASNHICPFLST